MEKKLAIEGMSCGHCTGRVQKYLEGVSGISNPKVDLENKEAVFSADDSVDLNVVAKQITDMGYKTEVK